MAGEGEFIALMRDLAGAEAARGLLDDVALIGDLVLTTDTLVEGVHYLPDDPADSIGWKLAAVNLSDLAAKGARPLGCLLNYALSGDAAWDADFARGLGEALERFAMPLIGGDTVMMPLGAPRALSLTALGRAQGAVPTRSGAQEGDVLYVSGPVGDAGAGLAMLKMGMREPLRLIEAYRRPQPRIALGKVLASVANASMDISDGLFIDAQRMALASDVAIVIDHVPVSHEYAALHGNDSAALLRAGCAGDDYELLVAMPADWDAAEGSQLIRIGKIQQGEGLHLMLGGAAISLPDYLGWEHGR